MKRSSYQSRPLEVLSEAAARPTGGEGDTEEDEDALCDRPDRDVHGGGG